VFDVNDQCWLEAEECTAAWGDKECVQENQTRSR
jgi:hypothetical protein